MKIGEFETHPAADELPLMSEDEFDELLESIEKHGQLEPVLIIKRTKVSLVIDGRNRLRACLKLGIEPVLKVYRGKRDMGTLVDHVLARNLHRRHLVPAERVVYTVNLLALAAQEKAAGRRRATQNNDSAGPDQANLPGQVSGQMRDVLAEKAGVSPRTVQSFLTVREKGVPELEAAILNDGISLSAAEDISRLDHQGQREVIEQAKGSPRSVRRILKEREASERRTQDGTGAEHASAPPTSKAFTAGMDELKAHLRRARGACAALVQATPWPDGLGPEARTAETDALIAAIDEVISKAGRLGTGPDLRLIHGGAGDAE